MLVEKAGEVYQSLMMRYILIQKMNGFLLNLKMEQ